MPEAAGTALDILADLDDRRLVGFPCRLTVMQAERPDLYEQWLRVRDETRYSQRQVAEWFTARGFTVSAQTIGNHRRGACVRCRTS
jgi:hypothetical protein